MNNDTLAARVRDTRKKLNMTQAELAEKIGMNRTVLGRLEKGEYLPSIPQLEALAEALVRGIEDGWKKERFWNRAAARVNDKMMLIDYLTPMLLASQEESCHDLAQALCEQWNRRWPENTYRTATYEALLNGFRHSIMGIDFAGKHNDE